MRAPVIMPRDANQRCSIDFVADVLSDGWRFRTPVVVDDFAREKLVLVVNLNSCCGYGQYLS